VCIAIIVTAILSYNRSQTNIVEMKHQSITMYKISLLTIIICKASPQLLPHLPKSCFSTVHLATSVIVFLHFFNSESKFLGNVPNGLIDDVDGMGIISFWHLGFSFNRRRTRFTGERWRKLIAILNQGQRFLAWFSAFFEILPPMPPRSSFSYPMKEAVQSLHELSTLSSLPCRPSPPQRDSF
jgi:hypothetical protein